MKFLRSLRSFRSASASNNHRTTLLELHRSGMMQVFRRHSIFRVWVPLRETCPANDSFAN